MSEVEIRNSKRCSPPPPDSASFSEEECLSKAEEAAEQVLNCIRPTPDSEERRKGVIDYIQRLIQTRLDCQIFLYGSVPLKTYLPEADIDLTAFRASHADKLARDVVAVLKAEELNVNAEYQVKDIQFIDAQVKLVKCIIQNIVVDITFNQLGGLFSLCFLEQIATLPYREVALSLSDNIESLDNDSVFSDTVVVAKANRIVGRSHLFKRSIILVKAWCFYESRILGAQHGLISTYGLGTLVMYIFNLFHSSLSGPLSVLHKFLEYYSQFDWETYGISLKGPVCISSLPNIIVKIPENGWENLLLKEEFLNNCIEMFSVPSWGLEEKPKEFQAKDLNIVDPLNKNNNIGRSVNRANCNRIRSAFKYGASKLGKILSRPSDKVAEGLCGFFVNTLAWHGHRHLPLKVGLMTVSLPSPVEFLSEDNMLTKPSGPDFDTVSLKLEAFDPLADLSGDYASHIRSLRYGQSCFWSTSLAPVTYNPPSYIVHQPEPPTQNQLSKMNSPKISMEQNLYPSSESALPLNASLSESKQNHKARGARTYFPRGNAYNERPSQMRGKIWVPVNNNRLQKYVQGRNNFERNVTCKVLLGQGRGRNSFERNITHGVMHVRDRGRGRSYIPRQPPPSVGDVNQTNDYCSGSLEIEFGSIGNLARELLSGRASVRCSTPG